MYREIVTIDVLDLKVGMVLAENIYDLEGNILLASGIKLRENYIKKIEETPIQRIAIENWIQGTNDPDRTNALQSMKEKRQARIEATRQESCVLLKSSLAVILEGNGINTTIMQEVIERIIQDILSSDDIVFHIDQLREVDEYLFDHAINVAILSIITGVVLGLNKHALKLIGMGAILHDVGKLFVDQDVLNKPSQLTSQEFVLIKHHSRLGYEVLKKSPDVTAESALVALNHHERFDGSGYPSGFKGEEIDLNSRIVCITDVFDALTSDRVYSKKISPYKAMQHIVKQASTHFDPELVKRFVNAIGYYYHGAVVVLHDNTIGVVIERDRYRPVVRVVQDSNTTVLHENYEIDLKKNPSVRIKTILTSEEFEALPYFKMKQTGIS